MQKNIAKDNGEIRPTTPTRSPVLMMIFNRPEPTQKVFEAIRAARPPRLYVAADGPRPYKKGEKQLCEKTRLLVMNIDWPCELRTLFRDENLGCKRACSDAVTWFFDNEEEGIILEDDIVPSSSFFPFCDELLERYRHNPRIGHICGLNPIRRTQSSNNSYIFSNYPFVWGWAAWRRAWKFYDRDMAAWPSWSGNGGLSSVSANNARFERYWRGILDATYAGGINTWDYQWAFACWRGGLVSIVPTLNQVDNIGFGADATHTSGGAPAYLRRNPAQQLSFPLTHPAQVTVAPSFQRDVDRRVLGLTTGREVRRFFYGLPFAERLAQALKRTIKYGA
jgi:hypothetical protein